MDQHISDSNDRRTAKLRTRAIQEICVSETNYIHQLDKLITVIFQINNSLMLQIYLNSSNRFKNVSINNLYFVYSILNDQ